MASPIIRMQQVHKRYGHNDVVVHALRGVDLAIDQGEFVAFLGPSGSGKSTLMNIIGCLDLPDTGTYHLDDEDITALGENALARIRNETIGFVFQSFNLLPRTSALENVATPMIYAGTGKQERQRRARTLLENYGLADRMHHFPNQLSSGQQQRVAIARAVANRPRILLADEPTGNLDTATGDEVMNTLQALNRDEGLTVIVITHEPEVAARAHRRLTLHDGRFEV